MERTKPTLQQLRQYTDYMIKAESCETLKTELQKLKDKFNESPDEFEHSDVSELANIDVNDFVHFKANTDWNSNDEGGSYISISSIIVEFPDKKLRFSWDDAEWLIDHMQNYSCLFEDADHVNNNPVEPFKMEVVV